MTTQVASTTQGMPGEVIEHLGRHHVITLSTSSFTGMPHADTVVYVNNADSIFFVAGEGTQMLRNVKDSRHVSFTVDDYTVDWRKVRELQGVGRCRPATEEQAAVAWSLCLLKFGQEFARPPGVIYVITRVKCISWITTTTWSPGSHRKSAGPSSWTTHLSRLRGAGFRPFSTD